MRKFQTLRKAMFVHDITGFDMARKLGIDAHTFSHRMTGRSPWKLSEMYQS